MICTHVVPTLKGGLIVHIAYHGVYQAANLTMSSMHDVDAEGGSDLDLAPSSRWLNVVNLKSSRAVFITSHSSRLLFALQKFCRDIYGGHCAHGKRSFRKMLSRIQCYCTACTLHQPQLQTMAHCTLHVSTTDIYTHVAVTL